MKKHIHWETFWHQVKNQPLLKNPPKYVYGGTNVEPLATIGMTAFLDAVKNKFNEGFSILDYGCGAGILINSISERLDNYTYYGLEPNEGDGLNRIALGKSLFNHDNVHFGFIETELEIILKKKLNCIVLISIFTHLSIDDVISVLDNLKMTFDYNKNCSIVFSCFTAENEKLVGHLPNIWKRFYGESYINIDKIKKYCDDNYLNLIKHMDFTAMNNFVHEIYKIEKI